MKISYAQMNPRLGDFSGNVTQILSAIQEAIQSGADILVLPEAALCGYPANDLLDWSTFVTDQRKALKVIQGAVPKNLQVVVGFYSLNPARRGRPFLNSVAIFEGKRKVRFVHKAILPVGDVFDEGRFFQEFTGKQNRILKVGKRRAMITICEEMWAWDLPRMRNAHLSNPFDEFKKEKVDLVINLSASPFHIKKHEERLVMAKKVVSAMKAPLLYVNRVGTQDEVLFDGGSFVMNRNGKLLNQSPRFQMDQRFLELDEKGFEFSKPSAAPTKPAELLFSALVYGVKNFLECSGIKKLHLGLSGGVDSALVAVIAAKAVGPENVTAVALPTEFNSPDSLSLSQVLATNLRIKLVEFPIQNIFNSVRKNVDSVFGIKQFSLVHENMQARIRGLLLMAYSNHSGSLLLATSNKSEFAVGYSTLYGDMCGGLAPIGDLTKEQVYSLCHWLNSAQEIVPQAILDRAPSAELRPEQKDSDSLPPYNELDPMVDEWVLSKRQTPRTDQEKWFVRQLLKSEFKRWQAPPVLKVTSRAFGKGRRWPISLFWEPGLSPKFQPLPKADKTNAH